MITKIIYSKNFGPKQIWSNKIFAPKKLSGPKTILAQNKPFQSKIIFWLEKKSDHKKTSPKKVSGPKKFLFKKFIFGTKMFFIGIKMK